MSWNKLEFLGIPRTLGIHFARVKCFKMEEGTKKQSQGKECSYSGCSNRMYVAKRKKTRFRYFTFPKNEKVC